MTRRLIAVALGALLASGCFAASAAFVVGEIMADTAQRHDLFEETLTEMDAHLEYVDEFVAIATDHVPALQRLIANTTTLMDQPVLAGVLAVGLTGNPAGLREVVSQTLGAALGQLPAEQALAEALGANAPVVAGLIGVQPEALSTTLGLLLGQAGADPTNPAALTAALVAAPSEALAPLVGEVLARASADPSSHGAMAAAIAGQADALAAILDANPQAREAVVAALARP